MPVFAVSAHTARYTASTTPSPASRTESEIGWTALERASCVARGGIEPDCSAIRRRNNPNRATTNPKAMTVRPVRTQASSVRSAAKKTRGSDSIWLREVVGERMMARGQYTKRFIQHGHIARSRRNRQPAPRLEGAHSLCERHRIGGRPEAEHRAIGRGDTVGHHHRGLGSDRQQRGKYGDVKFFSSPSTAYINAGAPSVNPSASPVVAVLAHP